MQFPLCITFSCFGFYVLYIKSETFKISQKTVMLVSNAWQGAELAINETQHIIMLLMDQANIHCRNKLKR